MNSPVSFEQNVFLKLKRSRGNINPFTTFKHWKCYKTIGSYVSCVFIEIWSTWEVWRALKKLELLSATPRATLTHLSCSPNFLRDMKHLGSLEGTQKARVALSYASSNSYASFMLSKLPVCFISWWTHADIWTNC